MIAAAWWTCALIAVSSARIFERCELAREFHQLGIEKEHVPTWVCIAFHESRFNTTAFNPGSGDHGLLQISELFWCGTGKACGVPCSSFRDDDIRDDVQCALQIHEEHTRLQGDGFMAWVVYPLHCKHTTKKYLADCDNVIKITSKPRARTYDNSSYLRNHNNILDDSNPPYLTINSLLREKSAITALSPMRNWINYKIDNIDKLKLPIFNKKSASVSSLATTRAPLTTTPSTLHLIRSTAIPKTTKAPVIEVQTNLLASTITTTSSPQTIKCPAFVSTYHPLTTNHSQCNTPYGIRATTYRVPTTTSRLQTTTYRTHTASRLQTTTYRVPTITSRLQTTTYRVPTTTTRLQTTTYRVPTTTSRLQTTTYRAPTATSRLQTTIDRPQTTSRLQTTTYPAPSAISRLQTTTYRPPTTYSQLQTTTYRPLTTTYRPIASKFSIRNGFFSIVKPSTTVKSSVTTSSIFKARTTAKPSTTNATSIIHKKQSETTPQSGETTQSIFDLYLKPTRRPKLATHNAPPRDSRYILRIFSDGTTAAPKTIQNISRAELILKRNIT